jgi:hypothetical protein
VPLVAKGHADEALVGLAVRARVARKRRQRHQQGVTPPGILLIEDLLRNNQRQRMDPYIMLPPGVEAVLPPQLPGVV